MGSDCCDDYIHYRLIYLLFMKEIKYIRRITSQQSGIDVPDGLPSQLLYLTHLSRRLLIKSQLFCPWDT